MDGNDVPTHVPRKVYEPDAPLDPAVTLYLQELQKEDIALHEAELAMEKARFDFELALRRYALVRDVVRQRFGVIPGSAPEDSIGEYIDLLEERPDREPFPTLGRWRFVHMPPGEAVVAALDEATQPLMLDELLALLRTGGMEIPDGRTINAALRNTTRVRRLPDGRYCLAKSRREEADSE